MAMSSVGRHCILSSGGIFRHPPYTGLLVDNHQLGWHCRKTGRCPEELLDRWLKSKGNICKSKSKSW